MVRKATSNGERIFEDAMCRGFDNNGFQEYSHRVYDRKNCVIKEPFFEFLLNTQTDVIERIQDACSLTKEQALEKVLLETIKSFNKKGKLQTLRKGIIINNILVTLVYNKPANNHYNSTAWLNYDFNTIQYIRQLRFSLIEKDKDESVDVALFVNGIIVFLHELKDKKLIEEAVKQYQERNLDETVFQCNKGAIVYFAVDTTEVKMATKLYNGGSTFLPFNQGSNGLGKDGGAGNPEPEEGKYGTAYLWEHALTKDNIIDLLLNLIVVDTTKKSNEKYKVKFPRYSQLHGYLFGVEEMKLKGTDVRILYQHSAGSGKTMTISLLAKNAAFLVDENGQKIYDIVFAITTRRNLNKNIQDEFKLLNMQDGFYELVDYKPVGGKSASLRVKTAIEDGKMVIICTMQTFNYIFNEILEEYKNLKYLIIFDEVHMGTDGDMMTNLYNTLGYKSSSPDAEFNTEEERNTTQINERLKGVPKNIGLIGFSATPDEEALQLFGKYDEVEEKYVPSHIYSFIQAIQEGYVLNPLERIVFRDITAKLRNNSGTNPTINTNNAIKKLNSLIRESQEIIEQEADDIVKFVTDELYPLLDETKAMVCAGSRTEAYSLYKSIKELLYNCGLAKEIQIGIAYTDTLDMDGRRKITDAELNTEHFGKKINNDDALLHEFNNNNKFRILVVADKFQLGFDCPKLSTLFVCKKVSSPIALVQLYCRINRLYNFKGKNKTTLIVDYYNTEEDVKNAFAPYLKGAYSINKVSRETLFSLKENINTFGVIQENDILDFQRYSLEPDERRFPNLNNLGERLYQRTLNVLPEKKDRRAFRITLNHYNEYFDKLSNANALEETDVDLLVLNDFIKYLLNYLPTDRNENNNDFMDEIIEITDVNIRTKPGEIKIEEIQNKPVSGNREFIVVSENELVKSINEIIQEYNRLHGLGNLTYEKEKRLLDIVRDWLNSKDSVATKNYIIDNKNNERNFQNTLNNKSADLLLKYATETGDNTFYKTEETRDTMISLLNKMILKFLLK